MRLVSLKYAALLVTISLPFAVNAHADALGSPINSRLSDGRISGNSAANRLSLKTEDLREKDQALQPASKKKVADATPPRRSRAISSEMRAKKTRRVVAGQ